MGNGIKRDGPKTRPWRIRLDLSGRVKKWKPTGWQKGEWHDYSGND